MLSSGSDGDDRRSSCPKCREYIEQVERVAESVDAIEKRMNELRTFFATHEWVLLKNAEDIKKIRNPEKEMDMDSLQHSYAQSVRFKRLADSALRSLERIRVSCEEFGGLDENQL